MSDELRRKIKDAKLLRKKYVQMMDEHMVKENMTDKDFNRRIMKVYHCMINAYDEIIKKLGFPTTNDVLLWNLPRNNSRLYTKRKKIQLFLCGIMTKNLTRHIS